MEERRCPYCGKSMLKGEIDREHVFPKCLYPASKRQSKVQRLTIPACHTCNNSWSDDEVHFRNVLSIAGNPNSARYELFRDNILSSFHEVDGERRWKELIDKIRPERMDDGSTGYKVYPFEDERVIRVAQKVIRGLSYFHRIDWPVLDKRVAVFFEQAIPQAVFDAMKYHHWEPDIAEYRYEVVNQYNINSAWLITFFQQVTFVGLVSISQDGFELFSKDTRL